MPVQKKIAGYIGGTIVVFAGKWTVRLANLHRVEQRLSPETIARLQPLFPNLDLGRIRIKDHANLPPNWFKFMVHADAMSFNERLYFVNTFNENDPRFLRLLVHELVHTDQVRRYGGEIRFACAYGIGHLEADGYENNPLEVEAREFARNNPIPPLT